VFSCSFGSLNLKMNASLGFLWLVSFRFVSCQLNYVNCRARMHAVGFELA